MPSKTLFSKPILILLLAIFLTIPALFSVSAHDFDNTSDEDIAPAGKLNIRGAKTSNLKVLVKYPTTLPNSKIVLEILLSDLTTKQPIAGVNITAIFNFVPENVTSNTTIKPIFTTVLPTEAMGNYLATTVLPQAGNYKLTLMMSKTGLNTQVIIPNITIPTKIPVSIDNPTSPYNYSIYFGIIGLITVLSVILVIVLSGKRNKKKIT